MAAIKVHGIPLSTCTARVLLCFHEKGLSYELIPTDLPNMSHKKQPYLSLNPFGQIPALEDGNVTLFESRAITRYLERKHAGVGTDLLWSGSLAESAIVDTWMEVEAHQFNQPVSTFIHQKMVNPIYGLPTDDQIVEAELQKLGKVFDVYEERLSESKYLAGEHYSMADLHHIPCLVYFTGIPESASVLSSRPRVAAWWSDISARSASIKVSAAMKI